MIPKLIYSILYFIVLIFLLPFQYRKRPKEFKQRWLREKFGFFESAAEQQSSRAEVKDLPTSELANFRASRLIWLHAVSVGEVMAAIPLLKRLKEKFPSINLLVSTITDTGQRIALEKTPEGTKVIYLPFDLNFILRKAFRNIKPNLFITMETELWPNLLMTLKGQGIPVMIMNGRISDDSFKGYRKIRFFMKGIIGCVDLFGMQDSVYAERIKALGASEEKVKVLGNFKFDTKPSEKIPEWTKLISSPVIIAGSTHRGEEELIISAYIDLKKNFPDLNLIIAPRHPERFGEVEELVKGKGLAYVKRSELDGSAEAQKRRSAEGRTTPPQFPPWQGGEKGEVQGEDRRGGLIILLDAMGELASIYGAADIAIMGGSFIAHGGQNLLEPAYWGKPIICGPHMENFPFVKEFYEKNAAIETTEPELRNKLRELLQSPEKRDALGRKAKALYDEKSGAVERAIKEIERFLTVC